MNTEEISWKYFKICLILTFTFIVILIAASSHADGVVLVNPTTIGVSKTSNKTVADAEKEMANLAQQLVNSHERIAELITQETIVNNRIDEILQQFQSVGIDLVDPR